MQGADHVRRRPYFGLIRRCRCWLPTARGWMALLLASTGLAIMAGRWVHPFLSPSDPVFGGDLVAEGWMPDYAMAQVVSEFKRNRYGKLYVTGGPIERGTLLQAYGTSAESGAAVLIRLGLDADAVRAVPAPRASADRTYVSALALKSLLLRQRVTAPKLTVMSLGVHARRTRALFQAAMGPFTRVGVIAVEDRSYDPARWWESSEGFRTVVDEVIAYAYATLLFAPEKEMLGARGVFAFEGFRNLVDDGLQ
ncbi:hypothetical protein ACWJKU_11460 [Methylocaldum sp. MU1018]